MQYPQSKGLRVYYSKRMNSPCLPHLLIPLCSVRLLHIVRLRSSVCLMSIS